MNFDGNDSELDQLLHSDEDDPIKPEDKPQQEKKEAKTKEKATLEALRCDLLDEFSSDMDPNEIINSEKEKTYELLIK